MTLVFPTNKLPRVKLVADAVMAKPADLAGFEGRYIVMTNQVFETGTPKFKAGDRAALKAVPADKLSLPVAPPLDGHAKPGHAINLFGVVSRLNPNGSVNEDHLLYAARFVPRNSKSVRQLATQHTCLTCHQINTPLIGPAYTLIGAKYRNDPQAIEKILEQINNGGSGKWGVIVMTPFKGLIKEEEKLLLAHWIYEMRWDAILND